jgi:hypothetical protein
VPSALPGKWFSESENAAAPLASDANLQEPSSHAVNFIADPQDMSWPRRVVVAMDAGAARRTREAMRGKRSFFELM